VSDLCAWNGGRLFGSCSSCSGLVQESSGLTTASSLMTRFQQFQGSLSQAIVEEVTEISSVSFSVDSSTSLFADVTLSSGVINLDQVYNQMTYLLSQIFDVYPGAITWNTVPASGKRQQTPNRIVLVFSDEVEYTGSSAILVPFVAAVVPVALMYLL